MICVARRARGRTCGRPRRSKQPLRRLSAPPSCAGQPKGSCALTAMQGGNARQSSRHSRRCFMAIGGRYDVEAAPGSSVDARRAPGGCPSAASRSGARPARASRCVRCAGAVAGLRRAAGSWGGRVGAAHGPTARGGRARRRATRGFRRPCDPHEAPPHQRRGGRLLRLQDDGCASKGPPRRSHRSRRPPRRDRHVDVGRRRPRTFLAR